jgi:uncharacterized protein (TIGR03083 family)
VEITGYIDVLRGQGAALASWAGRAGLDAGVPACPPWQVRDLLRHTGFVHRWAARHVTERPARVLDGPDEAEILRGGGPDADLIEWFAAGHAALVHALATADPGLSCGTFMPAPSPLAFWARRQAHETAIHRADAQLAAGSGPPEYPADFAADGIDELIMGFGRRRKYAPAAGPAGPAGGALRVLATDTGGGWLIEAQEGRLQPRRLPAPDTPAPHPSAPDSPAEASPAPDSPATAGCTVSGPASAVYLFLWNRSDPARPGVTITGDRSVLTRWQSGVRVRWG